MPISVETIYSVTYDLVRPRKCSLNQDDIEEALDYIRKQTGKKFETHEWGTPMCVIDAVLSDILDQMNKAARSGVIENADLS